VSVLHCGPQHQDILTVCDRNWGDLPQYKKKKPQYKAATRPRPLFKKPRSYACSIQSTGLGLSYKATERIKRKKIKKGRQKWEPFLEGVRWCEDHRRQKCQEK